MFKDGLGIKKAYIACGYTDLRYGVDGLAALIQTQFELNPFDEGTIFLFCGRRSDRIKALLWEGDGFLLLYKRLSNGRFQWPRSKEELRSLSSEQYHWLMSGLTVDPTIHKADVKYIL
jgi:transposase